MFIATIIFMNLLDSFYDHQTKEALKKNKATQKESKTFIWEIKRQTKELETILERIINEFH